jgi:hypothetical protein
LQPVSWTSTSLVAGSVCMKAFLLCHHGPVTSDLSATACSTCVPAPTPSCCRSDRHDRLAFPHRLVISAAGARVACYVHPTISTDMLSVWPQPHAHPQSNCRSLSHPVLLPPSLVYYKLFGVLLMVCGVSGLTRPRELPNGQSSTSRGFGGAWA